MSFFDKFRKKKKITETAPAKADQSQIPQEKEASLPKVAKGVRVEAKGVQNRAVSKGKTESPFGKPSGRWPSGRGLGTGKKVKTARPQKKDSKEAYQILIKPLLTEKSSDQGIYNKYIFKVAPHANKAVIKKALQSLYGVEPIAVNIINQSGKFTQYGRSAGYTKNWKKAIVTLKEGDKIELYEGV